MTAMPTVEGLTSVEGGYGRTGSRSPMQWDNSHNAGFSSCAEENLYIPIDKSPDRPTVASQQNDKDSLLNEVKKLISLRQNNRALQSKGEIEFIFAEKNKYPLAYIRSSDSEKVFIVINPSDEDAAFECDLTLNSSLYSFGAKLTSDGQKIISPARSVNVYRLL